MEAYIANAIPRDHGEAIVFQVEIDERVYGFELDAVGAVCTESKYIEDTAGIRNHHALALSAARDYLARYSLAHMKTVCPMRAVRAGTGFMFTQMGAM